MPTAPVTKIEEKVGTALATIIKEVATDLGIEESSIRPGILGEQLTRPCVVCAVGTFSERYLDSGVYTTEVVVAIHSIAPDVGQDEHNRRVGVVMDRLRSREIAEELTEAIDDFHVYQVKFMQAETEFAENCWTHKQALQIVCMPADSDDVAGEPTG